MHMVKRKYFKRFGVLMLALVTVMVLGSTSVFAAKEKLLGVASPQDSKNLFWKIWIAGFQDACKQLGIESMVVDGQGKEDIQLRGMEDAIVKGAKFLCYSPVGGTMGRSVAEKCEEAKVYNSTWCGIDPDQMPPSEFKYYTGFVTDSGEWEGYLLAKEFFKNIPKNAKIVAIHGVPG